MSNIGILGAGTWGMALARLLYNNGHGVTVWSALPQEIDSLSEERKHINLPGMDIPEGILFTKELSEVCANKELLIFAVPSVFVRSTAKNAAPHIPDGQLIADVAKGIEQGTLYTMTEIILEELRRDGRHDHVQAAALSGPTHAEEVAKDLPTLIVAACDDEAAARRVQELVNGGCMRVYTNTDTRGVELCGAMKNIIALVAGMSDGMGYGDNAKAAIITRGMAEIVRLGTAMGCRPETFAGLTGIGDLIVTATSRHSRNNRCGYLIGSGVPVTEAVRRIGMVVEGINALPAAVELAAKYGVDMPITQGAYEVVQGTVSAREVPPRLMARELKGE